MEWTKETVDQIFDNLSLKRDCLSNPVIHNYKVDNGKMLLVGISDFHYGLLSTDHSTGNEYNMEIAEKLFYETISKIKQEVAGKSFQKVIFLAGNDMINFNSLQNATSNNTPQDTAGLWFDVVDKAIEILIRGINELLPLSTQFEVVYVPSNHDLETMYGVMRVLNAYYRNNPNVTIDYSPLPYKYHQFGKCLFGFGHDLDKKKMLERFTTDAKDLWSSSEKMYWFLGHLHQAMQYEKTGYLEAYRLPTISGWSRWATNKGFSQTDRRSQCFIVDEKLGITNTINIVV